LILSAILFGLGAVAFVVKRNIITPIFMSIELMLNAVNLAFVAFSQGARQTRRASICPVRHCRRRSEAAVGLGIIILTARNRRSLNVERVDLLKL